MIPEQGVRIPMRIRDDAGMERDVFANKSAVDVIVVKPASCEGRPGR